MVGRKRVPLVGHPELKGNMKTKLTAPAMRAADALQMQLWIGHKRTHAITADEFIANIIDHETGLPELIAACRPALQFCEDMAEDYKDFGIPEIARQLRKALARAEGGE